MPTIEKSKPMYVQHTILCVAVAFLWATHDPDIASGQSTELTEAYTSYNTLYQQDHYSEAEPYAKEALRMGTEEFGPNDPSTANLLSPAKGIGGDTIEVAGQRIPLHGIRA